MSEEYVIFVNITYPVNDPENYKIESNAKEPAKILEEYIRAIMGAGKDDKEAAILDVYNIRVEIDLTDDTFTATSNCGNFGLRDGIVMDVISRLRG